VDKNKLSGHGVFGGVRTSGHKRPKIWVCGHYGRILQLPRWENNGFQILQNFDHRLSGLLSSLSELNHVAVSRGRCSRTFPLHSFQRW
jgi:hypothetical protein